jgi:hypothetical protein
MMVAANAEAQKSTKLAKEKKAKMTIIAQTARWHEKSPQRNLLYIYILRAPQLGGSHDSE